MRITPIEASLVFAIAGAVAAAAVPSFLRDLHASRLVEAVDTLSRASGQAVAYSQGRELPASFPAPAALTPGEVPRGKAVSDPKGTWDTPTWNALGVQFDAPHCFSFSFEVTPEPMRIGFVVSAHGDLNGDGVTSTFQVVGERRPGGESVVLPGMHVNREDE